MKLNQTINCIIELSSRTADWGYDIARRVIFCYVDISRSLESRKKRLFQGMLVPARDTGLGPGSNKPGEPDNIIPYNKNRSTNYSSSNDGRKAS